MAHAATPNKGLRAGALNLGASVVFGLASTAPAYSLAATLGLVVAGGVGVKAPAIMLIAFLPMYCIAIGYRELNLADPDCGTTFTWATRAFGPRIGWMGGWAIIAADVICLANLAQIAGSYSFTLLEECGVPNHLESNTAATTFAGLLWIAGMTHISFRGIEISVRLQYFFFALEIIALALLVGVALWRVVFDHAVVGSRHPQWSWLWPSGLSMGTLSSSVLLAVFIYWGWDSAVSTNEEADDPRRTPGRAAVLSTVLLLLIYVLVTVAAVSFAGTGAHGIGLANPAHEDDVFTALGPALFGPSVLGHIAFALLTVSILTSSAASTQTTILPTARTALSMAVFKALPRQFARVHPRFNTPIWATWGMGFVSMVFYLGMTFVSANMLTALIGAIGLEIAFYYGLTGVACTWFYRHSLFTNARTFLVRGVIPGFGGITLFVLLGYAAISYAAPSYLRDDEGHNITVWGVGAVAVVGVGSLLVGVVLMLVQQASSGAFFSGEVLVRGSAPDDDAVI